MHKYFHAFQSRNIFKALISCSSSSCWNYRDVRYRGAGYHNMPLQTEEAQGTKHGWQVPTWAVAMEKTYTMITGLCIPQCFPGATAGIVTETTSKFSPVCYRKRSVKQAHPTCGPRNMWDVSKLLWNNSSFWSSLWCPVCSVPPEIECVKTAPQ